MDVILLSPVYGQATESGSNLLGIDSGRELTRLFCPARQFVEAFQLSDKSDTVFPLPLFPQFFDQVSDQRVGRTVQQFIGMLLGGVGRVASQPSALGITVSPLDVVPSKLSLPVGQASGLLWQGKPPIGFSVGFCFLQSKGSRERICSLSSVVNVVKCNEIFSTKTTLTTLTTLTTPFPKNFFQKLFRVEKAIGANTSAFFCLHFSVCYVCCLLFAVCCLLCLLSTVYAVCFVCFVRSLLFAICSLQRQTADRDTAGCRRSRLQTANRREQQRADCRQQTQQTLCADCSLQFAVSAICSCCVCSLLSAVCSLLSAVCCLLPAGRCRGTCTGTDTDA